MKEMTLSTNTVLKLKNYCMQVYILMGLDIYIYKRETVKEQWLCQALCMEQSWRQSFLPVRIRSSLSQISILLKKKPKNPP